MKNIIISFVLACNILSFISIIHARDINLDSIYIKKNSLNYNRLLEKKIEAYQVVNSRFIDRNVIFAHWNNGFEIIYVKDLPRINIFYSYNRKSKKRREIIRLKGSITVVKRSSNGKYVFIKRLILKNSPIPNGETLLLNIDSKKITRLSPAYPFLDFSVSPGGNSILYETKKGIIELFPESDIKILVVKKSLYSNIARSNSPTIAYMSPNRKKIIIINGSGGAYKSKIISIRKSWKLHGITSAREIFWVDNRTIVYRRGNTGNFSVYLYDSKTNKSRRLIGNSLNTDIQYSRLTRIISFLKDQVINIYNIRHNYLYNTRLEGEDVNFSPDGNRFISLLLKKLFITNINIVKRKGIETKKIAKEIMIIYKNLLRSKRDWINEYSAQYIRRKIAVYKKISE